MFEPDSRGRRGRARRGGRRPARRDTDVTPMIDEVRDLAGERAAGARDRRTTTPTSAARAAPRCTVVARSSTPSPASSRSARWSALLLLCRSTSPSAATCAGCAPGWSASPTTRPPTSPRARARSTAPRPSSSDARRDAGRRAAAGDDDRPSRCPPRPGSPTSARRSSGSRWSGRRWRRIPRWRRFVATATQPRVLVAIGVVALLLGVGGDLRLRSSCSPTTRAPRGPHVGAIDPGGRHGRGAQRDLGQRARRQGRLRRRGERLRRSARSPAPTPGYEKTVGPLRRRAEAGGAEGRRRPRGRRSVEPLDRETARRSPAAPTWS